MRNPTGSKLWWASFYMTTIKAKFLVNFWKSRERCKQCLRRIDDGGVVIDHPQCLEGAGVIQSTQSFTTESSFMKRQAISLSPAIHLRFHS
jgi:hypothetical protein